MARASRIQRAWQGLVAAVLIVGAPPGGRADPGTEAAKPGAAAAKPGAEPARPGAATGEDDELYRCGKAKGEVKVSFRPGLELADLATWAMSFTCKSFLYPPRLASRPLSVTVMAPRPMAPAEAWRLFLVALQSMDLTLVAKGHLLEIVEAPTAKRQALPLFRAGSRSPAGEELVRILFRPRQVTSTNLSQALTPLASTDGEVADMAWAGAVLVTDYGSHIERMREMVEEIDRPGADQGLYFLPLRHAAAAELADTLRALLEPDARPAEAPRPAEARPDRSRPAAPQGGGKEASSPARILVDTRTSALILLASRAAYERTRALVERLDVAMEGTGSGRVHVHFLEHTSADKVAETLGALLGQRSSPSKAGERAAASPAPASPDRSVSLQGEVRVTADPLSNALLVLSSERDYLALQQILGQLDRPRPQVFIEALIIEVESGWSRAVGMAWHGGRLNRDGMWVGALGHQSLSSFVDLGAASEAGGGAPLISGFLGGFIGVPIPGAAELLGTSIPSFSVLFQALALSNHVEILSAPHVMTTDHVEARLSSGKTVSYQTGVTGLAGTAGGALGTVERKDIGLEFRVTPHVGASGRVRLDIDLTLEDVLSEPAQFGPSTSKRRIINSVVVGDQESAVLGGLVTHKVSRDDSKIPVLGDLPILGMLFRHRLRIEREANLVVLVTPYVVTDSVDGVRAVERVLERRGEFLGALERLGRMGFRRRGDGTRMRGLLAEIDRRVAQVEEQRAVLRELERRGPGPAGPIEVPSAE